MRIHTTTRSCIRSTREPSLSRTNTGENSTLPTTNHTHAHTRRILCPERTPSAAGRILCRRVVGASRGTHTSVDMLQHTSRMRYKEKSNGGMQESVCVHIHIIHTAYTGWHDNWLCGVVALYGTHVAVERRRLYIHTRATRSAVTWKYKTMQE